MSFHLEQGRNGKYWKDSIPDGLSLIRPSDRMTLIIAVLSLLGSSIIIVYKYLIGDPLYNSIPLLTSLFFFCGAFYMIRNKLWMFISVMLIIIAILTLKLPDMLFYLVLFITLGATGCVALVNAIQRWMFYRIIRIVEYINIKKKLSFWDRALAFAFNVPGDLDTRNIVLDYDLRRDKLPWREMGETIFLALMVGMLLWIYISMNPALMGNSSNYNIPMYVFSMVLLIPLLVLPWSIFKSLNVRIQTNYRDYRFYDGIKATLIRMALPVFATLFFVVIAINNTSILIVLAYIITSGVTIALVIVFTSVIYYVIFEPVIVNDIKSKWKVLRPAPLFVGLEKKERSDFDEVPGTPMRDKTDFGKLNFPGK